MKKRILAYILCVAMLLGTLGFSMPVSAAGNEYEVKIVGRLEKVGTVDTYVVEFKVKTLGNAVIGGNQELNIAYDTSILQLVQFNAPATAISITSADYVELNADVACLVIPSNDWNWSMVWGAIRGNIGYIGMQPWRKPSAGTEIYPNLTSFMSVRFTFKAGKSFGDFRSDTIRLATPTEAGDLKSSNVMFLNDGTATYIYGSTNPSTQNTLIFPEGYELLDFELPPPTYTATISPPGINFQKAFEGYSNEGMFQIFSVTNTGTGTITELSVAVGDKFEVSVPISKTTIAPEDSATFTVRPINGLLEGDYEGTLTVTGSNNATIPGVELTFKVEEAPPLPLAPIEFTNPIVGKKVTYGDGTIMLSELVELETEAGKTGTVTLSSSNPNRATIAADGEITILGAGSVTITANAAGIPNEYAPNYDTFDFMIEQAELTIKSAAASKEFDGNNVVTDIILNPSDLDGWIGEDADETEVGVVTATYKGTTFGTKDLDITAVELIGDKSSNYTVKPNSGAGNNTGMGIVKRIITITPTAGQTKVFGDPEPSEFTYDWSPKIIGDNFTVPAINGRLARAPGDDVGTYAYDITGLAIDDNYKLEPATPAVSFTITKATISPIFVDEVIQIRYNDETQQELDLAPFINSYLPSVGNLVYGAPTVAPAGIISGAIINGGKLTFKLVSGLPEAEATAVISVKVGEFKNYNDITLNVTVNVTEKTPAIVTVTPPDEIVYGGTLGNPSATSAGGIIFNYSYSGKMDNNTDFGPSLMKPTNPGSYTVTATLVSAEYSGFGTASFTINQKDLSWNATGTVADKVYDGNATATVATQPTLKDVINSDTVNVINGTVTFASKNAGDDIAVTASEFDINGADSWKYNKPAGEPSFENAKITKRPLTITGVTATDRAYAAGNTEVELTGGTLVNLIPNETVTPTLGKGTIASPDAGTGKAVTTNITIGGADAGNYSFTQPTTVTVNITKAELAITGITITPKAYDGTSALPAANVTAAAFNITDPAIAYDVINAEYTGGDYNVGSNKPTTVTIDLKAATAANYTLTNPTFTGATANIIKAGAPTGINQTVYVKEATAEDYTFDLSSLVPLIAAPMTFGTLTYTVTFADAGGTILGTNTYTSGNTLTIPVKDTAVQGTTATVNVKVASVNFADIDSKITVDVTEKIIVTISGITVADRAYNRQPITYTGTPVFNGLETGDTLTAIYTWSNGAAAPVNAGNYSLVVSADGGDTYAVNNLTLNFSITPAEITVTADDISLKVGADEPEEYTYTVAGLIAGDNWVKAPTATATPDMDKEGEYPIIVSGGDAGQNYTVKYAAGKLIVYLSDECDIIKVNTPANTTMEGTEIKATDTSASSVTVSVDVSENATWKLYKDSVCTDEITDKIMTLNVGENTAYILVTAENGRTTKVYTLAIRRTSSAGLIVDPTTTTQPPAETQPPAGAGETPPSATEPTIPTEEEKVPSLINGNAVEMVKNSDGSVSLVLTAEDMAKYPQKSNVYVIEVKGQDNMQISVSISALAGASVLQIKTDKGTVVFNKKMLAEYQAKYGDTFVISIKIGSFIVELLANGTAIDYNDPDNPLIIIIPINLAADTTTNGYVAVKKTAGINAILPYSTYKNGEVIFQTATTGTYDIIYNAKSFADVDAMNHWARPNITFVASRAIFNGTGADVFSPNASMTRAMFAQVLANIESADLSAYKGVSRFDDVAENEWYAPAVEWAAAAKIVGGYGEGLFGPEDAVNREQMAVMLARYIEYKNYNLPKTPAAAFSDESAIASWAVEAVKTMQSSGIINGKEGNLYDPQGTAMRAEAATIFARFIDIYISYVQEIGE